jgi:hypothetical protein
MGDVGLLNSEFKFQLFCQKGLKLVAQAVGFRFAAIRQQQPI